jgi:hypothetical protein
MQSSTDASPDRIAAFAAARKALINAHKLHTQVRQHRAINRITIGPYLLLQAVLLPAIFCGLLLWAQPQIFTLWRACVMFWATLLNLPLIHNLAQANSAKLGLMWLPPDGASGLPSYWIMTITAILVLALFASSFGMNGRAFPLKYLARIVCAVQGAALAYFFIFPNAYPYTIANHINDLASMIYVLLVAVPVMLSVGYYVLNIRLGVKILHTAWILLYFLAMLPFQVVCHVLLLQNFSLLFMPILYICMGTLFDMLIFIALYAWAVSTVPAKATT